MIEAIFSLNFGFLSHILVWMENIECLKDAITFLSEDEHDLKEKKEKNKIIENILDQISQKEGEDFIFSLPGETFDDLIKLLDYHGFENSISKIICVICSDFSILRKYVNCTDWGFVIVSLSRIFEENKGSYEGEDIINRIILIAGNICLFKENEELRSCIIESGLVDQILEFSTNNPIILETIAWFISVLFSCSYPNEEKIVLKAWELAISENDEIAYSSLKALYLFCTKNESVKSFLVENRQRIYETCTNDYYKLRKISMLILNKILDDSSFESEKEQVTDCIFSCIRIDDGKASSIAISILGRFMNEEIFYTSICSDEFIDKMINSELVVKSSFVKLIAALGAEYKISSIFANKLLFGVLDDFLDSSNSQEIFSVIVILGKLISEESEAKELAISFIKEKNDQIFSLADEYEVPDDFQRFSHFVETVLQLK